MNNNPYMRNYIASYNTFNQQAMYDQIDNEINNLQQMKEKMKNQMQQPTAINQTFQIAPSNHNGIRYANTIEDVAKEQVFYDTPYFSSDMSVVWIKNAKGDIKTYELNELIPKDEKDIQIEYLKSQVEELRGMIKDDTNVTNANAKQDTADTTTDDEPIGEPIKESKSSSIQKVSRSKKEQ